MFYTTQQTAKLLGLSIPRIKQLCQAGRLGQKVGVQWLMTKEEILEFARLDRPSGIHLNRRQSDA